ncbi:MAG TPA: hypothetical protein VF058_11925 [Actinomycetota bacterium]
MTLTPEQWRELEAIGLPPLPEPPAPPGPRALDDVLATRTHVKVLRVLTLDRSYNFTARGLARTAETSRTRALDVVRHLGSIGMLIGHHTHTHSIYRIRDTHPLTPALTVLFEVEAELAHRSEA